MRHHLHLIAPAQVSNACKVPSCRGRLQAEGHRERDAR